MTTAEEAKQLTIPGDEEAKRIVDGINDLTSSTCFPYENAARKRGWDCE